MAPPLLRIASSRLAFDASPEARGMDVDIE
jgi:hypothetical protein